MISLERQFLSFCRSKPAGEEYNPYRPFTCAVAQFGYPDMTHAKACKIGLGRAFEAAVVVRPTTFGALADRLEKTLVGGSE